MNINEHYITRCISLAKNGLGTTYPNPLVGSVIVYDEKIIGEGWHRKSGENHAEVNAILSVKDKSLLKKATLYVNLEPCCHFGKTPPCSDLIIKSEIPNVVVGSVDINNKVAGNGIKRMRDAGINVTVGILEKECYELNSRFFTFHQQKRPYIILKWAESKDGIIAPFKKTEGKPFWITNDYSRQLVHKWRTEEQAILVGTKTAIDDNPRLNARDWSGTSPIRIVIDKDQRISNEAHLFDDSQKTIVFSKSKDSKFSENILFEKIDFQQDIAQQIVDVLYNYEIQSVIIEGGRQTTQTFIDAGLWDEARIFIGNMYLNEGVKSPVLDRKKNRKKTILSDELLIVKRNDD